MRVQRTRTKQLRAPLQQRSGIRKVRSGISTHSFVQLLIGL